MSQKGNVLRGPNFFSLSLAYIRVGSNFKYNLVLHYVRVGAQMLKLRTRVRDIIWRLKRRHPIRGKCQRNVLYLASGSLLPVRCSALKMACAVFRLRWVLFILLIFT